MEYKSKTFVKNGLRAVIIKQTDEDVYVEIGMRDEEWNWYLVMKAIPKKDILPLMKYMENKKDAYEI